MQQGNHTDRWTGYSLTTLQDRGPSGTCITYLIKILYVEIFKCSSKNSQYIKRELLPTAHVFLRQLLHKSEHIVYRRGKVYHFARASIWL